MKSLDEIVCAVLSMSPRPADSREIAALLESLGYTDHSVRADFGFPTTFELGNYILGLSRENLKWLVQHSIETNASSVLRRELAFASRKFSSSFAFALPWTVMLFMEYLRPGEVGLSPQWGAALSLSLIGSLIAAGGFGQMIARSGHFYVAMKEAGLALRICGLFAKFGVAASVGAGIVGIALARYLDLFTLRYLVAAFLNFVALSLLWMLCSMLSIQGKHWRIPAVFAFGALSFSVMKTVLSTGTVSALFVANLLGTGLAGWFAFVGFRQMQTGTSWEQYEIPRLAALLQILAPYFGYGAAYFAFLFADRLAAGSAISWSSGLSFGIDSEYKEGMDIAVLIFLILAALVEYFSGSFMRFWHAQAEILPYSHKTEMIKRLRGLYRKFLLATVACFVPLLATVWAVVERGMAKVPLRALQTAAFGTLGYFFVCLALFNLIILFSVNSPAVALRIVVFGLGANFVPGYILSHLLGFQYAAVGLLLGGITLFVTSRRAVLHTLMHPDYFYSLA